MASPSTLITKLRDARMEFLGMFNKMSERSLFSGAFQTIPAPEGYGKIVSTAIPGRMEEKTQDGGSAATIEGIDGKSYEIATKVYRKTIGIDKDLLEREDAISQGAISRELSKQARAVVAERDRQLTSLLTTNGNDIFGSAFYANTKTMPGGQTIDNLISGAYGASSTEVKDGFFAAIEQLMGMVNAASYLYHGADAQDIRPIVMYPAALENLMQDAFSTQLLTAGVAGSNVLFNRAQLRVNPYLDATSTTDWYVMVPDAEFPVLWEARGKDPEIVSNIEAPDSDVILHDRFLFQVRAKFGVGYGSAFNTIKVVDS